ncbi:GAF and ANTAR domain-containing protein [Mycolicibacterium gadium]|uniref:GAF and ANTAR domain-containing protein n=1 Tax=Mycolicibacterium gadium TaxID=1794 RepID=A0ABT6GPD1_MYCGU|nr:GAF and ANTAR domain-containing protein [Mycolicibacterium gadium]MDG5483386.1 GAF and ANTAR domain-containing protein [Mycolicibacterium gadium]
METLTRDITDTDDDIGVILGRLTSAAVSLVKGVDYADVMLVQDGSFESVAPTDPLVTELDAVQMQSGDGPCLEAAVDTSIIRCDDVENDPRWPTFTAAALSFGVRATMSYQLYTNLGGAGALNLFSRRSHAVDSEGEAIGAVLATHAATAIMAVNTRQQFQSALASRDLIGQAKGILMNRFAIDAVRAFELIVKQSQDVNIPVREIAQKIIDVYGGKR